jgi:hypothetical protein
MCPMMGPEARPNRTHESNLLITDDCCHPDCNVRFLFAVRRIQGRRTGVRARRISKLSARLHQQHCREFLPSSVVGTCVAARSFFRICRRRNRVADWNLAAGRVLGASSVHSRYSLPAESDVRGMVGCRAQRANMAVLRLAAGHAASDIAACNLLCCRCGNSLGIR